MKNIFLSVLVLPLFIQSMQKPPVTAESKPVTLTLNEQKKIFFIDQKLSQMVQEFEDAKKRIRSATTPKDRSTAKLEYDLKAEEWSATIFRIMLLHPKNILIQIKKDRKLRIKMLTLLHNSDPAQDAPWAQDHENLLKSFDLDEPTSKNNIEWAFTFDKHSLITQRISQRYGTCLDQNFDIQTPVAGCSMILEERDLHKINVRRASLGLPSIEEQLADVYQKEQINKRRDC